MVAAGFVAAGFVIAACTTGTGQPTESTLASSVQTVTIPPVTIDPGPIACARTELTSPGQLQAPDLTETSGLAVGGGGTVWAVNDSGNAAGVFALTTAGDDRGFFPLVDVDGAPVATVDVEDLAMADGVLHIADIGDNNGVRDAITVHLVPAPDLSAGATTAAVADRVTITYPTGPIDAEAFLVDPVTGQLIILNKDLSTTETTVFTVDPPFTDQPMEATAAATFDLARWESVNGELTAGALVFPAAVTAADITPDGSLIAVRTYGTVWVFARQPGQSVAEALTGPPCEPGTAREGQGESLTFLPPASDQPANTVRFLTVSEGEFRPLNVATVQIS